MFESFVRFDLLARFAFCSHPSETVLKTRLTNQFARTESGTIPGTPQGVLGRFHAPWPRAASALEEGAGARALTNPVCFKPNDQIGFHRRTPRPNWTENLLSCKTSFQQFSGATGSSDKKRSIIDPQIGILSEYYHWPLLEAELVLWTSSKVMLSGKLQLQGVPCSFCFLPLCFSCKCKPFSNCHNCC